MINANELRIGNIVQDAISLEKTLYVRNINTESIVCGDNDFSHPYLLSGLKGIPLTPSILEKCGFVTDGDEYLGGTVWYNEQVQYIIRKDNTPMGAMAYGYFLNPSIFRYLHQLQNLFFSLTSKEIEYKP